MTETKPECGKNMDTGRGDHAGENAPPAGNGGGSHGQQRTEERQGGMDTGRNRVGLGVRKVRGPKARGDVPGSRPGEYKTSQVWIRLGG